MWICSRLKVDEIWIWRVILEVNRSGRKGGISISLNKNGKDDCSYQSEDETVKENSHVVSWFLLKLGIYPLPKCCISLEITVKDIRYG